MALWRDGGGGLWVGRSGPERPWNWLTETDASPDDLLLGESRKAEGPFEKVSPDDVRPSADLPDRDPRNGLTDECVLLQCLFDRFGSVFPQCGLMVFPGAVIVSR